MLHHMAQMVGKIQGFKAELSLLEMLLHQHRWLPGKRGYETLPLTYHWFF
jgi:hypothetical protein